MCEITDIFIRYITQHGSADMAEAAFKRDMHTDSELRVAYRKWCHEVGSSERNGFFDFCDEYIESQNDVWNTLTDFDE